MHKKLKWREKVNINIRINTRPFFEKVIMPFEK